MIDWPKKNNTKLFETESFSKCLRSSFQDFWCSIPFIVDTHIEGLLRFCIGHFTLWFVFSLLSVNLTGQSFFDGYSDSLYNLSSSTNFLLALKYKEWTMLFALLNRTQIWKLVYNLFQVGLLYTFEFLHWLFWFVFH